MHSSEQHIYGKILLISGSCNHQSYESDNINPLKRTIGITYKSWDAACRRCLSFIKSTDAQMMNSNNVYRSTFKCLSEYILTFVIEGHLVIGITNNVTSDISRKSPECL